MPFCGFNTKMITGLTIFVQGLFEATVERSKEKKIGIEKAFQEETDELGRFLEALEERYQKIKSAGAGSTDVMNEVAGWVAGKDISGKD